MEDVAEDIHAYGLKFGIYSSAGKYTCQRRPGSLGFEMQDAAAYSRWGVDYLKYDNCYNEGVAAIDRYTNMKNAITATGRDMFYSLCNWGNEGVAMWGKTIANSWRTTIDITTSMDAGSQWQSMKANYLVNIASAANAGQGGWNDPDLLLVGLGALTEDEERTHFALWSFAKAPLIISADLATISDSSLAILKNKEMIAINQDRLANQATCVQGCDPASPSSQHVYQSLVLPSDQEGVQMAVLAVNWDDAPSDLTFNLATIGVATGLGDSCTWRDVYTGVIEKSNGGDRTFAQVPAHGHIAKKIKCLPW